MTTKQGGEGKDNKALVGNSAREHRIQKLLRHSFVCHANHNYSSNFQCSCANNIKDFLTKDKKSIAWAKKQAKAHSTEGELK